jgi:hypothetical protein
LNWCVSGQGQWRGEGGLAKRMVEGTPNKDINKEYLKIVSTTLFLTK